jgi:hypothetical protein
LRVIASLLGILIGIAGLSIDFAILMPAVMTVSEANPVARSLPDALINFWTYFTHLTNLGLVLVYAAALTGWRWLAWFGKPQTRAAMAGYILLVMLYYHFMLSPFYQFEGPLLVATIILHYVAPIYYLVWWALFIPHGSLRFADIPAMLVPGVIYVAWALGRGALIGEYPYDILDAGKNGYGGVVLGVGMLLIAVSIFCAVLVGADRLLGRRATAQAA